MRKIGEVFEYKGVMLQVRIDYSEICDGCFFHQPGHICINNDIDITGDCLDEIQILFAKYTPTIIEVDE